MIASKDSIFLYSFAISLGGTAQSTSAKQTYSVFECLKPSSIAPPLPILSGKLITSKKSLYSNLSFSVTANELSLQPFKTSTT